MAQYLDSRSPSRLAAFFLPPAAPFGQEPGFTGPRTPDWVLRGWHPRNIETPRKQSLKALVVALADHLGEWRERSRGRQLLLSLDDRALHDIGISRATAEHEANLPFWRG